MSKDIIEDLHETAEYFRSDEGGDLIGAEACENAAKEINRLRSAMKQMREDFRRIQMLAEQHCPADASAVR